MHNYQSKENGKDKLNIVNEKKKNLNWRKNCLIAKHKENQEIINETVKADLSINFEKIDKNGIRITYELTVKNTVK